jgi:hypothetical protein
VKKCLYLLLAGLAVLTLTACQDRAPQTSAQPSSQPEAAAAKTGIVLESMNAGGYTYVHVDTGTEQIWAAAPQFAVQTGDPVVVPAGMPMSNHHSNTLDRTFETVYFVDSVIVGGVSEGSMPTGMPAGHPPITAPEAKQIDFTGLRKADGGKTVEEVFSAKDELSGKKVTLRAKVVKFSPQIMGKNWIHLQDGTGGEGNNNLTITSGDFAQVGDTVLVSGTLTTDKDFGFGYHYPVLVEDATVVVE